MTVAAITSVIPRLPSKNLDATLAFYSGLGFSLWGNRYPEYLMMERDGCELHFFLFEELNPLENYGMCYIRVKEVEQLHAQWKVAVPSLKAPELKPWRQKEMTVLDPDHNAITFGEAV
jgi:hypothetical protein